MYFFKPPWLQKALFNKFLWKIDTKEKDLYLTFDDGPSKDITQWVLNALDKHQAKATFFLKGKNIDSHEDLVKEIFQKGHGVGNHTYNHLDGWSAKSEDYIRDIEKCDEKLKSIGIDTNLFRPPYGRINYKSINNILEKHKVIMWSFLTGDFDQKLNVNQSLRAAKQVNHGSIMVYHDTAKAANNLKKILPDTLCYFADLGYQFKKIKE